MWPPYPSRRPHSLKLRRAPLDEAERVRSFPRKRESSYEQLSLGPRFRGDERRKFHRKAMRRSRFPSPSRGEGKKECGVSARFQTAPVWYTSAMTKDQVKSILDRVLTWPRERQQDAAEMLTLMEEQDKTTLCLTDEQVAEVKRRLADPNPKFLTLEEVRERFARRRA
jgi:hypothetical protein